MKRKQQAGINQAPKRGDQSKSEKMRKEERSQRIGEKKRNEGRNRKRQNAQIKGRDRRWLMTIAFVTSKSEITRKELRDLLDGQFGRWEGFDYWDRGKIGEPYRNPDAPYTVGKKVGRVYDSSK